MVWAHLGHGPRGEDTSAEYLLCSWHRNRPHSLGLTSLFNGDMGPWSRDMRLSSMARSAEGDKRLSSSMAMSASVFACQELQPAPTGPSGNAGKGGQLLKAVCGEDGAIAAGPTAVEQVWSATRQRLQELMQQALAQGRPRGPLGCPGMEEWGLGCSRRQAPPVVPIRPHSACQEEWGHKAAGTAGTRQCDAKTAEAGFSSCDALLQPQPSPTCKGEGRGPLSAVTKNWPCARGNTIQSTGLEPDQHAQDLEAAGPNRLPGEGSEALESLPSGVIELPLEQAQGLGTLLEASALEDVSGAHAKRRRIGDAYGSAEVGASADLAGVQSPDTCQLSGNLPAARGKGLGARLGAKQQPGSQNEKGFLMLLGQCDGFFSLGMEARRGELLVQPAPAASCTAQQATGKMLEVSLAVKPGVATEQPDSNLHTRSPDDVLIGQPDSPNLCPGSRDSWMSPTGREECGAAKAAPQGGRSNGRRRGLHVSPRRGEPGHQRVASERHRRSRIREGMSLLRAVVKEDGDYSAVLQAAVTYIRSLKNEITALST